MLSETADAHLHDVRRTDINKYTRRMLNIVGETQLGDLPAMFGLHNVPSAHRLPSVKQDIAIYLWPLHAYVLYIARTVSM